MTLDVAPKAEPVEFEALALGATTAAVRADRTAHLQERLTMRMSKKVWGRVRRYLKSTRAVSALEYAILVGVIAVGLTLALGTFKDSLTAALATLGTKVGTTVVGASDWG